MSPCLKGCLLNILNPLADKVLQTLASSAALEAVYQTTDSKDAPVAVFRLHLKHACGCRSIKFKEKGFYVHSGEGNTTDHFELCSEISTKAPEAGQSVELEMQK